VNIPVYNIDRMSFGPGIIYAGPVGQTPTTDIGAVQTGAVLTIGRTVLEVRQGSPGIVTDEFLQALDVTLTFNGLEWNLINLATLIGAGITTSTATEETFGLGESARINEVALRFVHSMPTGGTISIHLWKAAQNAEQAITFGDDLHATPFSLRAHRATTDWVGNALDKDESLFRIIYEKPA